MRKNLSNNRYNNKNNNYYQNLYNNLSKKYNELSTENNELKQNCENFKNQFEKCENEKNKMLNILENEQKKNDELNQKIIKLQQDLNNFKSINTELNYNYKKNENELKREKEKNQNIGLKFEFDKKIGCYDIIIDIQTIKELPKKGWVIKYPNKNKGKEYYKKKINVPTIVVGVIGNRNKGKSFLLEKLSGYEIPIGFNIKTEGLSVRYGEKENHNIAILDSAGQETPLFKENNYNNEKHNINKKEENEDNYKNKLNNKKIIFNKEKININKKREKLNILQEYNNKNEEDLKINNYYQTPLNEGNGFYNANMIDKKNGNNDNHSVQNDDCEFEEYSRDKLISEFFIQKFIIFKSNVLILVIGNITLNEQKLLSRVKKEAGKDKKIFVVHNLQNFNKKEQVDDYINGTLKNLYDIEIKENNFQDLINKNNFIDNSRYFKKYFIEEGGKIAHLIYINEFSDIGYYYNYPTLHFLKSQIESTMETQNFDIINDCKNFLINISEEIIEENLNENDFTLISNNNKEEIFKIKGNDKILNLKKFVVDEMGYTLNFDDNIPKFSYYIKENYFHIFIELPGGGDIEDNIKIVPGFYIFSFEGKKDGDIEIENDKNNGFNGKLKNKKSTRKNNKFKLDIKIPNTVIQLEENKPSEEAKFEKGVVEYKYKILEFGKGERERKKKF